MPASIFDDLAVEWGWTPATTSTMPAPALRPDLATTQRLPHILPQPPWRRDLDEALHALRAGCHHHTDLETLMAAIDSANEQLANLTQTIQGTVIPGLQQLADASTGAVAGVPEDAVQALADGMSSATSQLASAMQQALAALPQPQ